MCLAKFLIPQLELTSLHTFCTSLLGAKLLINFNFWLPDLRSQIFIKIAILLQTSAVKRKCLRKNENHSEFMLDSCLERIFY